MRTVQSLDNPSPELREIPGGTPAALPCPVGIQFRERIFSPLSPEEAHAVLEDVFMQMDALVEATADLDEAMTALDDEDNAPPAAIFDDIQIELEVAPPPTPAEAMLAAGATTYHPSSFVFEPAAMEQLPHCRSSILIVFEGWIADKAPFIATMRLLFERLGKIVIESGDKTLITTTATYEKEARKNIKAWSRVAPLGPLPKKSVPKSKPPRKAKRGELESLKLYRRLESMLKDPLGRNALRRELERAPSLHSYATALMNEGPKPDASLAKLLSVSPTAVPDLRHALGKLLADLT